MKNFLKAFLFRGLLAAWGGPVVLATIYGVLGATGTVASLTPREVCLGFLSLTLLAFFAGGMTAIYQLERLALAQAILLHGGGLYLAYLLVYLINGWLLRRIVPILVFTGIFLAGYAIIWLCIYLTTRARSNRINRKLRKYNQAKEL